MTGTTPCVRCRRTIEFDDGVASDDAVCMYCLTAEEDVDDTLAFVELMKRESANEDRAEQADELAERALENLQGRQASGEPVRRALAPDPEAAPPDEVDPIRGGHGR